MWFQLPPAPPAAWPPNEFRRKEGAFAGFAKPDEPFLQEYTKSSGPRMIIPCLEPVAGDVVIANGEQLHRVCEEREVPAPEHIRIVIHHNIDNDN